ncbi:hypothetical protein TrRE_jg11035 [Triparma retinervis]|uniref:GOLD domain-containing protein n=1 Tax=Triparma retinervis TaxID=2557542 RepID=A0A9W6ZQN6_9STRA|nr:hypothetical protein TrRE_jg11035 [Triparma retinervis]
MIQYLIFLTFLTLVIGAEDDTDTLPFFIVPINKQYCIGLSYPPSTLLSLTYTLTTDKAEGSVKITSASDGPKPPKLGSIKPHWGTTSTTSDISRPLKQSDTIVLTTGSEASMCFHVLGVSSWAGKQLPNDGVGVSVKIIRGPHHTSAPPPPSLQGVADTLRSFNERMAYALSTADAQKNQEAQFHKQSEAMNAASLFWPVVQIGVIMLAATGWMTGVVSFFKKTKLI